MESYIGHGGQFLFPFLFGKDLQVIFSTEFFIIINLLVELWLLNIDTYRPRCQIICDNFLPSYKFANSSVTVQLKIATPYYEVL